MTTPTTKQNTDEIDVTSNGMDTQPTTEETKTDVVAEAPAPVEAAPTLPAAAPASRGGSDRSFSKNPRRKSRPRAERPKSEFDQRIIGIRRVTRVVAGGRRFSFSVTVVAGNHKGAVGVGNGKAGDTALAVEKAYRTAVKHKIQIPLTETHSIAHDVEAKYSSGRVLLYPLPGRGIVAGGAVRDVLELAGLTNIGAKILSPSKNKLNNAQAAIKALQTLIPEGRRTQKKGKKKAGAKEEAVGDANA